MKRFCLFIIVWVGFCCLVRLDSLRGTESLESITQILRQNRELVQSLECQYRVVGDKPKSQRNHSVHWIQTSTVCRWKIHYDLDDSNIEFFWKDGIRRFLKEFPGNDPANEKYSSTIEAVSKKQFDQQPRSPWAEINYLSNLSPHPPIHEYLLDKEVTCELSNPKEQPSLVRVRCFQSKNLKCEFFFNKKQNYLPVKTVYFVMPNGSWRLEREVKQVSEPKPGIFFPTRIEQRYFEEGKLHETIRTEFSKVQINEAVDETALALKLPEGVHVLDMIENKSYEVDKNEQPKPTSVKEVPISKDEQDRLERLRPWYQRWEYWIGIILLILLVFIGYRGYSRFRSSN